MKYLVLHSTNFRDTSFFSPEGGVFNADQARAAVAEYKRNVGSETVGTYVLAGIVPADNLNDAYAFSQNECPDWRKLGQRSTSVGDVLMPIDNDYNYAGDPCVVDGIGFCQLARA